MEFLPRLMGQFVIVAWLVLTLWALLESPERVSLSIDVVRGDFEHQVNCARRTQLLDVGSRCVLHR